jgi:hypothetical protein
VCIERSTDVLYLESNFLTGTLPTELQNLVELSKLLSICSIMPRGSKGVIAHPVLKILVCRGSSLGPQRLRGVGAVPDLRPSKVGFDHERR